jgi:F0F1-type ATP synthase assembly protein I
MKPTGRGTNGKEPSPWPLVGAGVELGGVVAILALAGHWLDGRWHTGPWLVLAGLAIGLVGGTYNLWKQGQRFFGDGGPTARANSEDQPEDGSGRKD